MGRVATHRRLRERILSQIHVDEATGCWLWTAYVDRLGYGITTYRDRTYRVHRLMMELANRASGMFDKTNRSLVCHRCDTPGCVNPAHLFMGTPADNSHDRDQKGRTPKGPAHWRTAITFEQAREVRRLRSEGETGRSIAIKTGVPFTNIWNILQQRTWKEVV